MQTPELRYVVGPAGSDGNPGTESAPFATFRKARNAIRKRREASEAFHATVQFQEGVYHLDQPLYLNHEDSGQAESPLIIRSAPGVKVVLRGSKLLNAKALQPLRDPLLLGRLRKSVRSQVWVLDLRSMHLKRWGGLVRHGFKHPVPVPPPTLFLNDLPMRSSRWPKQGKVRMGRVVEDRYQSSPVPFFTKRHVFECNRIPEHPWHGEKDLWVDGIFTQLWEWSFNKVRHWDAGKGRVTLEYPEWQALNPNLAEFHFEHVFSELSEPGEYYIDYGSRRLFLIPPVDFDPLTARMELTLLDAPLLKLQDASHVRVEGLCLERTRAEGIRLKNGRDIQITRCEIRDVGLSGITLLGDDHLLTHCRLEQMGASGVELNGGDLQVLTGGRNRVEDCDIHDWGKWQKVYTPAVRLKGVGHLVTRCRLTEGPHMAIEVSGNSHEIRDNEIAEVCRDFSDMGAIYFNLGNQPLQRGTRITGNYFHDVGRTRKLISAIYVDRASQAVLISGNLFHEIGDSSEGVNYAIHANAPAHLVIENCLFIDCKGTLLMDFYVNGWGIREKETFLRDWKKAAQWLEEKGEAHRAAYPELATLNNLDPCQPAGNCFLQNVIWNPTHPTAHSGLLHVVNGSKDWLEIRGNLLAAKNPGFLDEKTGDYRPAKEASFAIIISEQLIPYFNTNRRRGAG